jgi:hypothetical protein
MIELSEQQIIDHVANRLAATYQLVEPDRVSRIVLDEHTRFDGRPIRDFVPLFVDRNATEELSTVGGGRPLQRTAA